MPMTQANGIDLHYELDGEGDETIVMINGLADDLETWALQLEDFLAAGYRVLRIDNRGVGKSDAPSRSEPSPRSSSGTARTSSRSSRWRWRRCRCRSTPTLRSST